MKILDTNDRPALPLLGYLQTIIFILLGAAVFLIFEDGYPRYRIQSTAAAWPTTIGVVEQSKVTSALLTSLETSRRYRADVIIRYQVGDGVYKINETYIGQSKWWHDSMEAYREANSYKVGQEVQVHYSPENHSVAAVDTEYRKLSSGFIWAVALGLFSLLSLYSTVEQHWRYIKSRRR